MAQRVALPLQASSTSLRIYLKFGSNEGGKGKAGSPPKCLSIVVNFLSVVNNKTSQELRMLSSVTLNCQATKIVMNSGSQLSQLVSQMSQAGVSICSENLIFSCPTF